jgi:biotin-dependent carboxylase uncharacterized domain
MTSHPRDTYTNSVYALATINKTGASTLVVDGGRRRCQHLGIAAAGAADQYAFQWANTLVGNPRQAPSLEITLGPLSLRFNSPARLAIAGAEATIKLNGIDRHCWSSFSVNAGDRLDIGYATAGLRYYLAIGGGFITERLFDSCTPLEADGSNHYLQAGETLQYRSDEGAATYKTFANASQSANLHKMTPWQLRPNYAAQLTLTLIPGYQFKQFSREAIRSLLKGEYVIGKDSNRMGYRLEGESLDVSSKPMTSEGIAYGSVQVPSNGQPIVLLNDRQTIGGYPKLGCVSARDCYALAQCRPGQSVRFSLDNPLPEKTFQSPPS